MKETPLDPTVRVEEKYELILTEREMQAVAHCLTRLFNLLHADKKTVPAEIAAPVMSALHKMKEANKNPLVKLLVT